MNEIPVVHATARFIDRGVGKIRHYLADGYCDSWGGAMPQIYPYPQTLGAFRAVTKEAKDGGATVLIFFEWGIMTHSIGPDGKLYEAHTLFDNRKSGKLGIMWVES